VFCAEFLKTTLSASQKKIVRLDENDLGFTQLRYFTDSMKMEPNFYKDRSHSLVIESTMDKKKIFIKKRFHKIDL